MRHEIPSLGERQLAEKDREGTEIAALRVRNLCEGCLDDVGVVPLDQDPVSLPARYSGVTVHPRVAPERAAPALADAAG
jgi:hypothetical protein